MVETDLKGTRFYHLGPADDRLRREVTEVSGESLESLTENPRVIRLRVVEIEPGLTEIFPYRGKGSEYDPWKF